MKKRTLLPLTLGILASPVFSQEVTTTTTPEIATQTSESSVAPSIPAQPPLEAIFQIATKPTPQDKIINVLAEPLDIERFNSKPDANTQKITDYQVLSLPNGFSPDGITVAKDGTIYVASIISGKIVKGKADGSKISDYLVDSEHKGGSWGMDLTANDKYLWVAGGLAGTARSYNAQTGELVANVTLSNFGVVNDLIVTEKAVYLTNSSFPILYKIPLNAEGKQSGKASVIKLSGEFDFSPKYFANANGIDYDRDTHRLIVNHSQLGKYYSINPETGEAKEIDLQGETSSNDGIAIAGSVLVGVEPPKNQVAIFQLSNDHKQATLSQRLTADVLDFPTLVAYDDDYWYIVNGKLSTKATPDVAYEIVKIARNTVAFKLQQQWQIDGLSQPESVLATPDSDWVYISNVNGKDAGFISRVSKSGKVDELHWVDDVQNPTGMALYNGKLYVVNKQEVVVIDSQSATIEQRIPTTGKWINDIAVTNNGIFYVGDLVTGQIFTFKAGDTAMQLWLQNEAIQHANGLLVDGDSLIVGTVGTELAPQLPPEKWGSLYRVSLADKSVELMANSAFKGNFDGVMKFGNGLLTTVSQQGKTYLEQDGQFIEIPQPIAGNITDSSLVEGTFYAPYMMDNQVINYAIEKVK